MHIHLFHLIFSAHSALALSRRAPAGIAITNNILELTTVQNAHHPISPSSKHLARRRNELITKRIARRQHHPAGYVQDDLLTIGGRVYMAKVTIAGKLYTLVIDTGSADTWVASSLFECQNPFNDWSFADEDCGFGPSYNPSTGTFKQITFPFAVNYTGGEFLKGRMGTEDFAFGKGHKVSVRQMIGVVDEGYWMGDGISSGLMGLGYPALARGINSRELNYTSVLYTLFANHVPAIFSLALSRPSETDLRAGGLLAIGGIPDIPHENNWVQVPIQPFFQGLYAWYQIGVDGFDIIPPESEESSSRSRTKPTKWFDRLRNPHTQPSKQEKPSTGSSKRQTDNPFHEYRASVILDSGTSLLYLPDDMAQHTASLFDPPAWFDEYSNMYIVSCDARAPRVGVRIGGETFWMSEHDLMNKGIEAVGGPGLGADHGECVVAIQGAEGGTLVLGDAWLNNVLVVFDVRNGTDMGPGGTDGKGNGGGIVRIVGREEY